MESTLALNEKECKDGAPLDGERWKALTKEVRARTAHGTLYQILQDDVEYKEEDLLASIVADRRKRGAKCAKPCTCCWTCPHCGSKLKKMSKKHFESKICLTAQVIPSP
jgi:hypothetical protein